MNQLIYSLFASLICLNLAACGDSAAPESSEQAGHANASATSGAGTLAADAVHGVWLTDNYSKELTVIKPGGVFEVYFHRVKGEPRRAGEWEIRDDGFYWCFVEGRTSDGERIDYIKIDGGKKWVKLPLSVIDKDTLVVTRDQSNGIQFAQPTITWKRHGELQ